MSVIKSWIKKNHDKLALFGSDIHHVEDFLSTITESEINNLEFAEFIENFKKWEESFQQKVNDEGTVLVECELDEHYNLVKLIDKKSKEWESNFMNHCVRQYNDTKHVYSIRHNITKKPVCTIELENNEIKQIKGKGNQRVSIKYVDYVIKSLNYFNCKILS